jgi:hypothetical protein
LNNLRIKNLSLLSLICLGILSAALLAGCGSSSDEPAATGSSGGKSAKPTRQAAAEPEPEPAQDQDHDPGVTTTQVGEAEPGSPEQTVLEWWMDVQINDPEAARDLYLEPPALPDLAGQFNVIEGKLDGTVKIVDTAEGEGGTASVKAGWTMPSGKTKVVELGLEEDGGEWKLSSIPFVNEMVEQLLEAEEGA